MTRDLHYRSGTWYVIDDITGFKRRNTEVQRDWRGYYTDWKNWAHRHPQDFVRGVYDKQSTPYSRPDTATSVGSPVGIVTATTLLASG